MPIIDRTTAPPVDEQQMKTWRPLHRIENRGGNVSVTSAAIQASPFERLLYAEGDSWFDKFTPLGSRGTNLLDALRLPVFAGVVDVSNIGDTVDQMTTGWQRRQTVAQFKLFDFDAILLSAGGNDLKDLFASLYQDVANRAAGLPTLNDAGRLDAMARGGLGADDFFDDVIRKIGFFVSLRDAAGSAKTRRAPVVLHGYDHLQPRPARARVFPGSSLGSGPWIYPSLQAAGLSDAEMLDAARQVIDELNRRLREMVQRLPADNVFFLDQRGTLDLAAPASTAESGDWIDEIHPTAAGFGKLGVRYWNPWLAKALNLV